MLKFPASSSASARKSYVPSDKITSLSQLQALVFTIALHKLLSVDSIIDTAEPSSVFELPININASFSL